MERIDHHRRRRRCRLLPAVSGLVALTLVTAGCSSSSTSSVASKSNDRPATTGTDRERRDATEQAVSDLRQFLQVWTRDGLKAAAKTYVAPDGQPPGELQLTSGSVESFSVEKWQSADNFTLLVSLDLHFPNGDGAAFGEGRNDRFVTFSRPAPGRHFVMSFATGP